MLWGAKKIRILLFKQYPDELIPSVDKAGDVLVFTYVGMETKQVTVGKESTANVSLINADSELDAVVVLTSSR